MHSICRQLILQSRDWLAISGNGYIDYFNIIFLSGISAWVVEMVLVKRNNSMYTKQFKLYKREWELEEIAATEVREMRHDMKQQYMYLRNWQIGSERRAHRSIGKLIENLRKGASGIKNREPGN